MIPDSIKTMQLAKIEDINELRRALEILLGAVERQEQRIKDLEHLNQKQSDELSILKGGNARPVFKNKKKVGKNISSGGKEKGSGAANKIEGKRPKEVHCGYMPVIPISVLKCTAMTRP